MSESFKSQSRVRVLCFYHDAMGQMLRSGKSANSICRHLNSAGVDVTVSGVRQYLGKWQIYPRSEKIGMKGIQYVPGERKLTIYPFKSSRREERGASVLAKVIKPKASKQVKPKGLTLGPAYERLERKRPDSLDKRKVPVQKENDVNEFSPIMVEVGTLKAEKEAWWENLKDMGGNPLFWREDGKWRFSGAVANMDCGFFALAGAHRYATAAFPKEIEGHLKRISMDLVGKMFLSLVSRPWNGETIYGFTPNFGKRCRGMNEWQEFLRSPRWWRRKMLVEGSLGGYFLPFSMAWSGMGQEQTTELFKSYESEFDSPSKEYVLPGELSDSTTQQLVPQEYLDLVTDRDKLTRGIYFREISR